MRMIYVCGLAHCGSTAFGLKLAYEKKALMLGEIDSVFTAGDFKTLIRDFNDENTAEKCSCGKRMPECIFWGDYYKQKFSSDKQKYKWLIDKVEELGYGNIINTIKHPKFISRWEDIVPLNKIYYIFRSPIDWAISQKNAMKRMKKRPYSLVWCMLLWYLINYKEERKLMRITKDYETVFINDRIQFPEEKIEHHIAVSNRGKYKFR